MPYDFKKEQRQFYAPPETPVLVTLPAQNYAAVRGQGDPNQPGGAYQQAVGILYAVSYTLKMSGKHGRSIPGFFEYVVPPLEGFWWQEGVDGVDYSNKAGFQWISVIRLPDFITPADFAWAVAAAGRKKKLDCSAAEFLTVEEGLCVQMMHRGPYDTEPATVAAMHRFARENGYAVDLSPARLHHELYLSDPRKTAPAKLKTVVRHPVRPLAPESR